MNQKARADSTEELLDVIRAGDAKGTDDAKGRPRLWRKRHSGNGGGMRRHRGFSLGLNVAGKAGIGVDITSESIDIIKLSRKDNKARLLMLERIELDEDVQPGKPGFSSVLAEVLGRYCDKPKDCSIWALLRTSEMDVSRLKLPKMPAKRLPAAVYWQLQKEKKFDDKEYILDYIEQGELVEQGVAKHDIITCLAKREDVLALERVFTEAGHALSGITLVPAAFQAVYDTGFGPHIEEAAANIHIDSDFTCITIFSEGRMLFSRTIKFGINSIADDLMEGYNSSSGPDDELTMPTEENQVEKQRTMTRRDAVRMVEEVLLDKREGAGGAYGLSAGQVLDSVVESLERVGRQTDRTLEYFAQNFGVRADQLHLSGAVFANSRVVDFLVSQLGLPVAPFDPIGQLKTKSKSALLDDPVQRVKFNENLALALCRRGRTLNLLYTYKGRRFEARRRLVRNVGSLVSMLLTLVLAGLFVYGDRQVRERHDELAALSARLLENPVVEESQMQLMAARTGARQVRIGKVAERYRSVAVLQDVSGLLPEGVRLLALRLDLGEEPETGRAQARTQDEQAGPTAVLDGIVLGDTRSAETRLTRLLANLENSPLFSEVNVALSQEQAFVPEGAVLHFVLEAVMAADTGEGAT